MELRTSKKIRQRWRTAAQRDLNARRKKEKKELLDSTGRDIFMDTFVLIKTRRWREREVERERRRSKRGRRKERELDGATVTKRKTQNNAASIRTIIQTSQNDKCRTCWTLATGCSWSRVFWALPSITSSPSSRLAQVTSGKLSCPHRLFSLLPPEPSSLLWVLLFSLAFLSVYLIRSYSKRQTMYFPF